MFSNKKEAIINAFSGYGYLSICLENQIQINGIINIPNTIPIFEIPSANKVGVI